jgi:lysophospholipase L1-like esterase
MGGLMRHLLLSISALLSSFAFSQTIVMETYGDSITAGLFDYTNITENNELSYVSAILSDLSSFKLTKDRTFLKKHEQSEFSWPTYLTSRLKDSETQFEIRNFALSGAKSDGLMEEVTNAPKPEANRNVIAFFFIGHNDLCHHKGSVENLGQEYLTNVQTAIEEWDKKHQDARAYLVSVAEVQNIYPILDEFVWHDGPRARYRCNENWKHFFPYCPAFYNRHKQGTLNSYVAPRLEAVNGSLDKIVETMKRSSGRNQYFRVNKSSGTELKKEYFAVDCYHLSRNGQDFLAEQIYEAIKWQSF